MAGLTTAKDVPYFDGDFWPNTLEETIADEEKKNIEESIDCGAVDVEVTPLVYRLYYDVFVVSRIYLF